MAEMAQKFEQFCIFCVIILQPTLRLITDFLPPLWNTERDFLIKKQMNSYIPAVLFSAIILCWLISSFSVYLFTSLPGTWARSVTYRPSWKNPQRRSRRSKKRYSTRKYSGAVQLPAGNLPAASTLLPDWARAFFKGFLWLLWPKKAWFLWQLVKIAAQSTCK